MDQEWTSFVKEVQKLPGNKVYLTMKVFLYWFKITFTYVSVTLRLGCPEGHFFSAYI